jgi:hypothetical protein
VCTAWLRPAVAAAFIVLMNAWHPDISLADGSARRTMAPDLAFREFPMTLQFVHGGVDRDGAPLHFHIRDGRISGLNGEAAPADGAECVDLQGFAVLPGLVDGHIHLDKSFVGDRWHPHQPVNSLRERLAVEKAAVAGAAPMVDRAEALIRQCSASARWRCAATSISTAAPACVISKRCARPRCAAPTSCASSWWRSRRPG